MQVWKTWKGEQRIIGNLVLNHNGIVTALTLDGKTVYLTSDSCTITHQTTGWYYGETGKRYIRPPIL